MSQLGFFQTKPELDPAARTKLVRGGLIYEPKGRAREYAALACNLYRGCDHGCDYCFGPSATRKARSDFVQSTTRGPDFLRKLEREASKFQAAGITGRVLLCFTCDPYQNLDVQERVTRHAIQILHNHGLHVEVLTKGGSRALRDLELLTDRDAFATTLTLLDEAASRHWEPRAALPSDRIATIRKFHAASIPTWVSLEPVLDPVAALDIIGQTHQFVDIFKLGTLNYHEHAKTIDWPQFADYAVSLLKNLGFHRNTDPDTLQAGDFYVKRELAKYLTA